ncbi:MAG: serine/threonine protein kinase [Oscillospiraceae bacterium]|nr:serine/threonine protein kinase [Oscillospiraceae bacterium]
MAIGTLNQVWPEWELEKQLGKGSYGSVYQAVRRDHNVESHAAIKIISIPSDEAELNALRSEGLDANASKIYLNGIVNDFVNEIQLMQSLKGIQNIVSVEDYKVVEKTDSIGWDIYIRMELLTPFPAYVLANKMTESEVAKLGYDICTALEICGRRSIIHRDIKPENIFVNDFGDFKLGDFGIARKLENVTGGLSQKGTFNYMAPEVANSGMYDARVDIYSLGLVLYRLLNGNRLPFLESDQQLLSPNERRMAVDRRIRGEALPAPRDASPAMANLILRACAFDPDRRFATAAEMKQALLSVSSGAVHTFYTDWERTDPSPAPHGSTSPTSPTSPTTPPSPTEDPNATVAVRRARTAPPGAANPVSVPNAYSARSAMRDSVEAQNTFGEKRSKRRGLKIFLVILAVALLAGGGVFAYLKLSGGKNSYNGFYFYYEGYGDFEMDCYVQLCDGKWTMSPDNRFGQELTGTYTVSGSDITFHYDLDRWDDAYDEILYATGATGSGDIVLYTGTIKDRKLSLYLDDKIQGDFYRDATTSQNVNTSFPNGSYYQYAGNRFYGESFIRLNEGKWENGAGITGTYTLNGNEITLRYSAYGDSFITYSGTVKDGKLTLTKVNGQEQAAQVYYLDGVKN